jgi:predicted enzyme related to lactoylglutathione lyase
VAGKVVHIEFPAHDANRATGFYSGLFGWQFQDAGMPGLDYRMFQGEPGGAVYPSEQAGTGLIVYFETDDIDRDTERVRELGGEAEDKAPIPHVGWFARCKDTEGNAFSFFQSDESVPPPSA